MKFFDLEMKGMARATNARKDRVVTWFSGGTTAHPCTGDDVANLVNVRGSEECEKDGVIWSFNLNQGTNPGNDCAGHFY